jgi:alkanesulfonate monooxygenase SsuD/methylene tetrahydromethanopterin reductase-like flavin-dependent oxidoreductase (luciferase family)
MLRLTAQYADGWNAWVNQSDNSPAGIPALRAAVDAACAAVGRAPATLWRSSAVLVEVNGAVPFTPGTRLLAILAWPATDGDRRAVGSGFRAYAEEGISHLQVGVNPSTVAGVEQLAPVLEVLDRG